MIHVEHELECQACGATFEPGVYPRGCPDCRERDRFGRLEVPDGDVRPASLPSGGREPSSMWDYRDLLPLLSDDPVTLGEGGTPVVRAEGPSRETGARVLLKNETVNPTWSYKDRLNALLISNVVALGVDRVAVSSTGNHGASTAAYARRAGVEDVVVLLPRESEPPVRAQVRSYGAAVVVTDHDERAGLLRELVDRGWYPTMNVTAEHTTQPYACEAYTTIAFELVDQVGVPDAVVVPTGVGDGLYGVWKGFRELAALGVVEESPRMIAAQSEERAPLVRTLEEGADRVLADPGPLPITLSTGGESAGGHALRALRESGGTAYAVDREGVRRALRETAREGVLPETASALAPAAARRAVEEGVVGDGDTVVCLITGAGVKWPAEVTAAAGDVPEIEPTLPALRAAVPMAID